MDTTAGEILKITARAGSLGKLVGFTGQQVGALGATFVALKTPPEVAATSMNALITTLATADCELLNGPVVWHAFTTNEMMTVQVQYCGSVPIFELYWPWLAGACPCGSFIPADDIDTFPALDDAPGSYVKVRLYQCFTDAASEFAAV